MTLTYKVKKQGLSQANEKKHTIKVFQFGLKFGMSDKVFFNRFCYTRGRRLKGYTTSGEMELSPWSISGETIDLSLTITLRAQVA